MGTIQDELKNKGYVNQNLNRLGLKNDIKQTMIYELTQMATTKFKHPIRGKINHRRPKKGKVIIMSEAELIKENRIRAINSILRALSTDVIPGKRMYEIVYGQFGGHIDSKKRKLIQNILQHLKLKSNGMIILGDNGWTLNYRKWEELGKPNIYNFCYPHGYKNRLRIKEGELPIRKKGSDIIPELKKSKKKDEIPSGTDLGIGTKIDSHSITPTEASERSLDLRKMAVITFTKNENIIIERDGVTVEIIPSNYDLVKIVL